MRYAQIAVPLVLLVMAAPAAHASWFKKDSDSSSKVQTVAKQAAKTQAPAAAHKVQNKIAVSAKPKVQKKSAEVKSMVVEGNAKFVDMNVNDGAPRIVVPDAKNKPQATRLDNEEFKKRKKEIEGLNRSVRAAKAVRNIPSSHTVQSVGSIPRKATYAPAKGNGALTVELGALPKSTISGAAGAKPVKP